MNEDISKKITISSNSSSVENLHCTENKVPRPSGKTLNRKAKHLKSKTLDSFVINEYFDNKILSLFKQQFTELYHKTSNVKSLLEVKDLLLEYSELTDYYIDIFNNNQYVKTILGHFYLKRAATAFMICTRLSVKFQKSFNDFKPIVYPLLYTLEDIELLEMVEITEYSKNNKMRNVQCFILPPATEKDMNHVINWYKKRSRLFGFNSPELSQKEKEKTLYGTFFCRIPGCNYISRIRDGLCNDHLERGFS